MTTKSSAVANKAGPGGAKEPGPRATPLTLREEIEQAAKGLSFLSESDYAFQFFTLPLWDNTDFTPEGFLSCLGISQMLIDELNLPVDRVIEERTFADFLPTTDDLAARNGTDASDPEVVAESKGYRELEAALRKRLRDLKVFRVGQVEIRCYLAGLDENGHIAGVVTTAVET
jgi:hypothetical protein